MRIKEWGLGLGREDFNLRFPISVEDLDQDWTFGFKLGFRIGDWGLGSVIGMVIWELMIGTWDRDLGLVLEGGDQNEKLGTAEWNWRLGIRIGD